MLQGCFGAAVAPSQLLGVNIFGQQYFWTTKNIDIQKYCRDLADPEDYTIVTKLHSLTDEEKKKIKESTAKFVNGCKFYASEEGLAEIVEKSTPWYFAWEDTFEARARKKGNFENILTLLCGT
jgi:hypothetical protein